MPLHSDYRQLYNSMVEAFNAVALNFFVVEVTHDKQGYPTDVVYREVNQATERLIGKNRSELIGKSRRELFGNVDDEFPSKFDHVLKSGNSTHFQTYGAALNKYYDVYAWKLEQNQVAVLLTDITERKKAEETLLQNNIKISEIIESIQEYFYALDRNWNFTYINRQAAKLFGAEPADLIGKNIWKAFPRSIGTEFEKNYRAAMEKHEVRHFEAKGVAANVWLIVNVFPSEEGITALAVDITERKKTEEALKESEERYRLIVETTNEGVWAGSPDGKTIFINQRMADMLGYRKEDIMGHTGLEFMDKRQDVQVHENRRLLKNKNSVQFECKFRRKDGTTLWTMANTAPILDSDGKHIANIAMHTDITERKVAEEALKRQAQLIDLSPDAIIVRQENGKITFWSNGAQNLYGYSREEAVGRISHDLLQTVFPSSLPLIEQEVKTKGSWKGELIHRTKTGTEVVVQSRWLTEKTGQTLSILESNIDISEQKNAEQALRESQERFSVAFNASPIPLVVTRWSDGQYVFVNQTFLRLFEYKMEEVIGHTSLELNIYVIPEGRSDFLKLVNKGQVNSLEMAFRTKNGKILDTLVSTEKITLEKKDHIVTSLVDITDRKKQQKKTEDQATLINLSPDAIIIKKIDDTITFWSKGAKELYGWTEEEAIGQKSRQLFKTKFLEPYEEILAELHFKGSWSGEKVHTTKEGKQIIVNSRWLAKKNEKRQLLEIFETNEDITTRKMAEKALKQRTEQLEETQKKLEENAILLEEYANQMEELAKQRLYQLQDSERLAAIGATAGMVGHDIRNPLQGITGELYFAKKDLMKLEVNPTTISIKENLLAIEESVGYINKIVQDLQDFARPIQAVLIEINLEELTKNVLSNLKVPSNISTVCFIDEASKFIRTDPVLLKRVLTNLANNAIEAMLDGGKLEINACRKDDMVIVSVSDTGAGIPDEVKPKLFTPLVTTKSKGQGFGLSVVKRMTEALEGSVRFESQKGKGTKFIISLPQPPAHSRYCRN